MAATGLSAYAREIFGQHRAQIGAFTRRCNREYDIARV
jgi:hypothetical protein